MKIKSLLTFGTGVILFLSGCYQAPKIPGFESDKWKNSLDNCDGYRAEASQVLLDQWQDLKGASQNEVRQLLGKETQHQLYLRNQKFFFYDLNCPDDTTQLQLRIRFDALGHVREMLKEEKESNP